MVVAAKVKQETDLNTLVKLYLLRCDVEGQVSLYGGGIWRDPMLVSADRRRGAHPSPCAGNHAGSHLRLPGSCCGDGRKP